MVAPKPSSRRGRVLFVLGTLLVTVLFAAAFLFPFLLKRYIENNSEAWIGRRITIGRIVLNPLTGVYAVTDLVCFEPRSEQVFVRFAKLGVKGSVLDGLMNDHWSFREAELRGPYVHIVQNGDRFNFSDLLELAGGEEEQENATSDAAEVGFTVVDIALTDGRIDYESDLLHEPLNMVDVAITSTRITSGDGRMDFIVGMGMPDGTRLDGGFVIDTAFYAVDARLREFDLAGSLPYLQDFFQAGHLAGKLDMDLHVRQSYADSSDLALSARMELRGLELRDPQQEHLLTIDRIHAGLDTLLGDHFELGAVEINGLDIRFALLADSTDNWTRLLKLAPDTTAGSEEGLVLAASESNYFVLLADYISYLGVAITASDYTADSIVFHNGRLRYEDHSVPRSQRYDISAVELRAKRFTAESGAAPVTATATLNDVGKVMLNAVFDPQDLRNVDLHLVVDSLMMAPLDPYVHWYAAHPAVDGVVRYESTTSIRNGQIDSQNHLLIDRLKFGKRQDQHSPDIYVLPLRLAAGLLKDAKGVIELDVPLQGDLRDPEFRVWPIVWQVLKNLVVKAVTAPAKMVARLFQGVDERDLELVRFRELQGVLEKPQEHGLNELAKALALKPELAVDLVPLADSLTEAGQLALFTAKSRYLFPGATALGPDDSLRVHDLAVRDSSFVQWMDERSPGTRDVDMAERSSRLFGVAETMGEWGLLEQARREHVMQFLLAAGAEPARIRFAPATAAERATYGGVPGYFFRYDASEEPLE
jgi:hypothetical protein